MQYVNKFSLMAEARFTDIYSYLRSSSDKKIPSFSSVGTVGYSRGPSNLFLPGNPSVYRDYQNESEVTQGLQESNKKN